MKKVFIILSVLFFYFNLIAQEDHSELVDGPFNSPPEVTETCLMCHEVQEDIMNTRHWKWLGEEFETKHGEKITFGKQDIINNFCIATSSNWPRCTSCHIGYGWKDASFVDPEIILKRKQELTKNHQLVLECLKKM